METNLIRPCNLRTWYHESESPILRIGDKSALVSSNGQLGGQRRIGL